MGVSRSFSKLFFQAFFFRSHGFFCARGLSHVSLHPIFIIVVAGWELYSRALGAFPLLCRFSFYENSFY